MVASAVYADRGTSKPVFAEGTDVFATVPDLAARAVQTQSEAREACAPVATAVIQTYHEAEEAGTPTVYSFTLHMTRLWQRMTSLIENMHVGALLVLQLWKLYQLSVLRLVKIFQQSVPTFYKLYRYNNHSFEDFFSPSSSIIYGCSYWSPLSLRIWLIIVFVFCSCR